MFLVYGVDKELVVNGYVGASLDTDPDALGRNLDTYLYWMVELLVGAVPSKASWQDLRVKQST